MESPLNNLTLQSPFLLLLPQTGANPLSVPPVLPSPENTPGQVFSDAVDGVFTALINESAALSSESVLPGQARPQMIKGEGAIVFAAADPLNNPLTGAAENTAGASKSSNDLTAQTDPFATGKPSEPPLNTAVSLPASPRLITPGDASPAAVVLDAADSPPEDSFAGGFRPAGAAIDGGTRTDPISNPAHGDNAAASLLLVTPQQQVPPRLNNPEPAGNVNTASQSVNGLSQSMAPVQIKSEANIVDRAGPPAQSSAPPLQTSDKINAGENGALASSLQHSPATQADAVTAAAIPGEGGAIVSVSPSTAKPGQAAPQTNDNPDTDGGERPQAAFPAAPQVAPPQMTPGQIMPNPIITGLNINGEVKSQPEAPDELITPLKSVPESAALRNPHNSNTPVSNNSNMQAAPGSAAVAADQTAPQAPAAAPGSGAVSAAIQASGGQNSGPFQADQPGIMRDTPISAAFVHDLSAAGDAAGANGRMSERVEALRVTAETTPQRTAPQSSETAPPVRELAIQISRHADAGMNRFQMRLDPPELGRVEVRMEISPEGRLSAVIAADRPDTLDLLQRDSRALERSLLDAGIKTDSGGLSFSLRGGRNDGGQAERQPDARQNSGADWLDGLAETPDTPVQLMRFSTRTINIRI